MNTKECETVIGHIRPLLPADWRVNEGFFLSLRGSASDGHVSISPPRSEFRVPGEKWDDRRRRLLPGVQKVSEVLRQAGYDPKLDCLTLYILTTKET